MPTKQSLPLSVIANEVKQSPFDLRRRTDPSQLSEIASLAKKPASSQGHDEKGEIASTAENHCLLARTDQGRCHCEAMTLPFMAVAILVLMFWVEYRGGFSYLLD